MGIAESLETIEEALSLRLSWQAFMVSGGATGLVDLGLGFKIPVKLSVTSWFREDSTGVLLEGVGNLAIVAAHFPPTDAVSVYLLDNQHGVKVERKMSLKQVLSTNRESIRAAFYQRCGKWKKVDVEKLPV